MSGSGTRASGFPAAWRRQVRAIWASCSRVRPWSCMYRLASIATHVDAENASYGAVNSIMPPMRRGPRLSESARLPPCWAVDSQTERKQTTWSTTPAATASAASITGPSWPAVSPVPRCQRVRSPSASWSWVEPAPLNPGRRGGPGYDATPSMSSGLSPASSIARRHASTVRARPERPAAGRSVTHRSR